MLNHLEKKQEQKIRRLAEMESDKAARSIRIPAVIGMVEAWSFFAALRRGAERGNDPRAGVEALAALANGAGALKSGMVQFFESSIYSELSARAAKPGASKVPQVLGNIASADLQALKAGAAHWVAAGSVLFAGKDLVDAKISHNENETRLAYAYMTRAGSSFVAGFGAIGSAYNIEKRIQLLRMTIQVANLFKGATWVGTAGVAAATYFIGEIKKDDWIRWLEKQPFRRSESKHIAHSSDRAMEEELANVIADIEILG